MSGHIHLKRREKLRNVFPEMVFFTNMQEFSVQKSQTIF